MAIFGYARVVTNGQSLASQDAQLHAAGCAKVYAEKVSSAYSYRPELAKVIKRLGTGDVLMVTRLDRLARSTRDLLKILDAIGKAGAGFKSLGDAWADTTTAHGLVTILAGLAEFERELVLARTSDGRARAKAKGVKFGRPSSLTSHQREEAMQRLANGEAQADIARSYAVSRSTISRLAPGPFGEDADVEDGRTAGTWTQHSAKIATAAR
jgi:DNA invertase Pin-like site-specific DNA recombinase